MVPELGTKLLQIKTDDKVCRSISQIISFNLRKKAQSSKPLIRHTHDKMTAFPLYMGLLLHSKTRQKCLIKKLSKFGIRVSYDKVQDCQMAITKQLCKKYQEKGIVCPPLRKGLFTTAAIDNLDHNPSSSLSIECFHGTSISIFQHPKQLGNE